MAKEAGDHVILRTRMRRRLLNRIKNIAAHDAEILGENWTMSDAVRELLMEWADVREKQIETAKAAQFSGSPPADPPTPNSLIQTLHPKLTSGTRINA